MNKHSPPVATASTGLLPTLGNAASLKRQAIEVTSTQLAQQLIQLANITVSQNYRTGLRQLSGHHAALSMTQQLLTVLPKTTLTEIKLSLHPLYQSTVTCLLPLSTERQLLWFTQFGIRGMKRRLIAHTGVGRRSWENQKFWGYNIFLDRDLNWHHMRGGVGLEAGRHGLTLSANYYTGITGWKASQVITDQDEKPATGGDIRLRWCLERYPQWTGQLLYEHYRGEKVLLTADQPWQQNPDQLTFGVHYTPIPLLTLGVDYQYSSRQHRQFMGKLLLVYHLGRPGKWQITPGNKSSSSHDFNKKPPNFFVNRRYDMVFAYRQRPSITLLLPDTISGEAEQQVPLYPKIASTHPLSHIEWQHSAFTAAGGQIGQKEAGSYWIQLPAWQATGSNHYPVRAIAYDSCGHASQPAECQVTVHPAELDLTRSTVTIEPNTIIANGKEHATLVVKARSKRNQPLRNIPALQWRLEIAGMDNSHIVVDDSKESPQHPGVYATTLRATMAGSARLTPLYSNHRLPPVTLTLLPCPTGKSVTDPEHSEEKKEEGDQKSTDPVGNLNHPDDSPPLSQLFDHQACEIQLDPITQEQQGWRTIVKLTLRDKQRQPVSGLADQITPLFVADNRENPDSLPLLPKIDKFSELAPGVYQAKIVSQQKGSGWLYINIANQFLPKRVYLQMISQKKKRPKLYLTLIPPYSYGKKLMSVGNQHPVRIQVKTAQGSLPPNCYSNIKVEVVSSDPQVTIAGSPASLNAQGQGEVTVTSNFSIDSVDLIGKVCNKTKYHFFDNPHQDDQDIVGVTTVSFAAPFSIKSITTPDNLPGLTGIGSSIAQLNTAWEGASFTLQTSGLPGHWSVSNPEVLTIINEGHHHVTFKFQKQPHDRIVLIGLSDGLEVIRETVFITHWVTNPSCRKQ